VTDICTIYSTFPNEEEAARVARALVEEGLAACANIIGPCRSIYAWQGEMEDAREVAALFKTTAEGADALIARLAALHSYDVPAAVAWPIVAAHLPYADWVAQSVRGGDAPRRD
jgi:periplasmic divalent cation tolerance protein